MAQVYADENVPETVTNALRAIGHDVLTARDDGRANQQIPDPDVLARATALGRIVVTGNRQHYHGLHRIVPNHAGIVTYTEDLQDPAGLAARISDALRAYADFAGRCVRVIRPNPPPPKVP